MSTSLDHCTAIGLAARHAGQALASTSLAVRNAALHAIRAGLLANSGAIEAANTLDLEAAARDGLESVVVKRLLLDAPKLAALATGIQDLEGLKDPIGVVTLDRELSPGLELRRISCPIGVLCVIFESRPEAVVQIASLAIKSGNAVVLKGGKEAAHSNAALVAVIRDALASAAATGEDGVGGASVAAVPVDAVQFVSSREDVGELLKLDTLIDVGVVTHVEHATVI